MLILSITVLTVATLIAVVTISLMDPYVDGVMIGLFGFAVPIIGALVSLVHKQNIQESKLDTIHDVTNSRLDSVLEELSEARKLISALQSVLSEVHGGRTPVDGE